jgi:prepilin-type N-terminal cleavage/methylation domain-containing protein
MQPQGFVIDKRGFTIAELMVALAMLAIVIGAIYGVFASVNRTCAKNEAVAGVMQTLRTSLEFLEQDIRMAGLDRYDSADAGIEVATATNLRFTADRNMDGVINTADLADGIQEADLERIVDDWQIMAENVDDFQFAYLDADHNLLAFPIADLSEIRSVQIIVTMEQPAGLAGPVSRTLSKRILCRNLDF